MKKPERQTYFLAIVREHKGQDQPGAKPAIFAFYSPMRVSLPGLRLSRLSNKMKRAFLPFSPLPVNLWTSLHSRPTDCERAWVGAHRFNESEMARSSSSLRATTRK
jgi:hypothetical protein